MLLFRSEPPAWPARLDKEIFLYACCTHKNCRFGEVSFLAPVYKSSRISATQQPIRNKFGTNVEKGRLVRNPQKNWKFVMPTYSPFPHGRSHIYIYTYYIYICLSRFCACAAHAQDNNNNNYLHVQSVAMVFLVYREGLACSCL